MFWQQTMCKLNVYNLCMYVNVWLYIQPLLHHHWMSSCHQHHLDPTDVNMTHCNLHNDFALTQYFYNKPMVYQHIYLFRYTYIYKSLLLGMTDILQHTNITGWNCVTPNAITCIVYVMLYWSHAMLLQPICLLPQNWSQLVNRTSQLAKLKPYK